MPIASFEEEQQLTQQTSSAPMQVFRGMSGWLVKKGLASNQTSADLTLIVLAGLAVLVAGFIFYHSRSGGSTISQEELQRNIQKMRNVQPIAAPESIQ